MRTDAHLLAFLAVFPNALQKRGVAPRLFAMLLLLGLMLPLGGLLFSTTQASAQETSPDSALATPPAPADLISASGHDSARGATAGEAAHDVGHDVGHDGGNAAAGNAPATPWSSTGLPDLSRRDTLSSAMQIIVLLTVLSLAPAILIMMTSFTRIIIVLSLLRQALGAQQLPPNQVLIGLSLFMTFMIMGPTWNRLNNEAIRPYLDGKLDQRTAMVRAEQPVRDFMINQILKCGNSEDVYLFTDFAHQHPKKFSDVGTMTLIPAFMLSELKTAFFMGFKIYLPFLIIDMVISTVLISMGMMMLPPALISLPFKLLLFVMVDGWRLITGSLLGSFVT